ncbi:hypothetical protein E9531_05610 [Lampropedia puyangensis]|uniref:Uncharacterized protein n=1 Tax=Lampropedia puyangensis TaxID=1330072 RepID=A0A4V4GS01_9BURK|nr:hypothetical protein [Lampropedia puyangensis]THU03666.1 hypothetical protein E9531_05610 [Lampropedia puyangensis]
MQNIVVVQLSADQELQLLAHSNPSPLEARQWLDEQFVALDCEPLRASGKVLIADKVLAIAATASSSLWADEAWAQQFAASTLAAFGKPVVKIDIPAMSVSF